MSSLLISYGTLTMNSEIVAIKFAELAKDSNKFSSIDVKNVIDINTPTELEFYDYILIGTSTWGEGDYPPDPEEFMDKVKISDVNLKGKNFMFFGLGDTSYEHFCGAIDKMKDIFVNEFGVKVIGETLKLDGFPDDVVLAQAEDWFKKKISLISN